MLEALKRIAREAEISLIMFGEALQRVECTFDACPLEVLERRYMVHDEPVIKLQPEHNKPWYNDHRNNRSKKSRRKL